MPQFRQVQNGGSDYIENTSEFRVCWGQYVLLSSGFVIFSLQYDARWNKLSEI